MVVPQKAIKLLCFRSFRYIYFLTFILFEYSGAAEPPFRCGVSHLSEMNWATALLILENCRFLSWKYLLTDQLVQSRSDKHHEQSGQRFHRWEVRRFRLTAGTSLLPCVWNRKWWIFYDISLSEFQKYQVAVHGSKEAGAIHQWSAGQVSCIFFTLYHSCHFFWHLTIQSEDPEGVRIKSGNTAYMLPSPGHIPDMFFLTP